MSTSLRILASALIGLMAGVTTLSGVCKVVGIASFQYAFYTVGAADYPLVHFLPVPFILGAGSLLTDLRGWKGWGRASASSITCFAWGCFLLMFAA